MTYTLVITWKQFHELVRYLIDQGHDCIWNEWFAEHKMIDYEISQKNYLQHLPLIPLKFEDEEAAMIFKLTYL
jgi:hypothetical protein